MGCIFWLAMTRVSDDIWKKSKARMCFLNISFVLSAPLHLPPPSQAENEASHWIIWLRTSKYCIINMHACCDQLHFASELTMCSRPLTSFTFLGESLVGLNKERWGFPARTAVPSRATLWPPSSGHFTCLNNNCYIWEGIVKAIIQQLVLKHNQ